MKVHAFHISAILFQEDSPRLLVLPALLLVALLVLLVLVVVLVLLVLLFVLLLLLIATMEECSIIIFASARHSGTAPSVPYRFALIMALYRAISALVHHTGLASFVKQVH